MSILPILVLMPQAGQPRFHKRIRMLEAAGLPVILAAFDRHYYGSAPEGKKVAHLGQLRHGRYFARIRPYLKAIGALRSLGPVQAVYSFGTDLSALARLAFPRARHIVEIGDIREVLVTRTLPAALIREVDERVVRRADGVVVTSELFWAKYYRERRGVAHSRLLVLENRIDGYAEERLLPMRNRMESLQEEKGGTGREGTLTIGWFGLLRCRESWRALLAWKNRDPDRRRLLVAGMPGIDGPTEEELRAEAGVDFRGVFQWPDDLPALYGGVDAVCAFAPIPPGGLPNKLWARGNRFYESCFFRRPLLVLDGGGDSGDVLRWEIGMAVPVQDGRILDETLDGIDAERLATWRAGFKEVPEAAYLASRGDPERLISFLRRNGVRTSEERA